MNARTLPLLGFVLVFALLGFGIYWSQRHDPREVPSPLIGKPAPQFSLPVLGDAAKKEIFVKSVTPKEGRSGNLIFVTYGVRITGPRGLVMEDDQNIVFRDEPPAGAKRTGAPLGRWARSRTEVVPDPASTVLAASTTSGVER